MVVHHYPDSARQGQVLRLCARRGTRAVNKHGTSVCHPSPKIRVNTVWPEAGKEAGHVAVSSLRKLLSGGTATPTAILLSSCRVSTSLTTYQGSWLGPSPCVAASYGKGRGCTTADRLVENGGQHQWGEEKTPSQPLQRARSHTGHLGPFGVPAALLRPHMVLAVIQPRNPSCHTCHPRIRRATKIAYGCVIGFSHPINLQSQYTSHCHPSPASPPNAR